MSLGQAVLAVALASLAGACDGGATPRLEVLGSTPHDPGAFTEGLVWHAGRLYESTGGFGGSSLRDVALASGEVRRSVALDAALFGEGLARVGGRLVQLTWKNGVALVWDEAGFTPAGTFAYDGQGWGLCAAGDELWMSNGTATLVRRDAATFAIRGSLEVHGAEPVGALNELECVGRHVYANVWPTSRILKIDTATGEVVAAIDTAAVLPLGEAALADQNGIAFDASDGTFLVTGKLWPKVFRMSFGLAP